MRSTTPRKDVHLATAVALASGAAGLATLPGDLVWDLDNRNEEEIESLLARLTDVESEAEVAEREVRDHLGQTLLDPDVAADLVPEPPVPEVDPDRPRMTVVRRAAPGAPAARADRRSRTSTSATAPEGTSAGLASRLTTSHWWWRIDIVLVLVALVLLKFS